MRAILSRDALRQATVGNVRGMTGSALSTSFDGRITHISGNEIPASRIIGPLTVKADYTVVPGTVVGLTPTIDVDSTDVPISDVPAPQLPITGTGTEYVVINFFGTFSNSPDDEFVRSVTFTSITLTVETTAPTGDDLISDGTEGSGTPQFKLLLATIVNGIKTLQAYDYSLWFKVCDDMSRTATGQLEQTNPP
jgi:hypothetical protein